MDILYVLLGVIAYLAVLVWIAVEEIKHENHACQGLMEVETAFPLAVGVGWVALGVALGQTQSAAIFVTCIVIGASLLICVLITHCIGSYSTNGFYKRYRPIYGLKYFVVQVLMVLTAVPILLFWFVRYDRKT